MEKSHKEMKEDYKKETLLRRAVQKENCQLERKLALHKRESKDWKTQLQEGTKRYLTTKITYNYYAPNARQLQKKKNHCAWNTVKNYRMYITNTRTY